MFLSKISNINMILRETSPHLPKPWNPKFIDPALLTYEEYYKIANHDNKFHVSSAYNFSIADLNDDGFYAKNKYPTLAQNIKKNGLSFQVRLHTEERNYVKVDNSNNIIRNDNGDALFYSPEEIKRMGKQELSYSFAIFNENNECVGIAQDEWGAMLVSVAKEYRGFGFGPILIKLARTYEPGKTSGGFTSAGKYNFTKVHREFVRDALTSGLYNSLLKQGKITKERIKEIINSAKLNIKSNKNDTRNLDSNNSKDFLLYHENSSFVIYSKILKDHWEDRYGYFTEKFIKGDIELIDHDGYGIITLFGGDSAAIKKLLIALAASWCHNEGLIFMVDEEDEKYIDREFLNVSEKPNKQSGMSRYHVKLKNGEPLPYENMSIIEKRFRKSFDKYDEFKNTVLEMAYEKYHNN